MSLKSGTSMRLYADTGPICTNTSGSIVAFLRYSWRSVIGWVVSLFRRFREPMDAKKQCAIMSRWCCFVEHCEFQTFPPEIPSISVEVICGF